MKFTIQLRLVCIFAFVFSILIYYMIVSSPNHRNHKLERDISCYDNNALGYTVEKLSGSENTIYFLETSCKGGLNSRQACSVESAARANPNWIVKVFLAGPVGPAYQKVRTLSALSSMSNVHFLHLNVAEFTNGTVLKWLFNKDAIKLSAYPVVHAADLLRILILNKYGGVYLDMDVIVLKSFNELPKNFVTKESKDDVASCMFAFTKDGVGKNFTDATLEYISNNYDPNSWGGNGPKLFRHSLDKLCDHEPIERMSSDTCKGIHVFDPKYFCPIRYENWHMYYEDYKIDDSEAYTHHLWNKLGGDTKVPENSLFSKLAQKYCPSVYQLYKSDFGS